MKALKFGALHCLLILSVGILPGAGFALDDDLHHRVGGCIDCESGPLDNPVDCGVDFCVGMATSCGSLHGLSMIGVDIPIRLPAPSDVAVAERGTDAIGAPPPSRIDRPPIT